MRVAPSQHKPELSYPNARDFSYTVCSFGQLFTDVLACGQPRSISATLNHCIQQKTSGTQGGANVYPIAGVTLAQGLPSFLVNRPSLKSSIVVQLHVPLVIQQYHSLVLGERELDSFMSFSTRQKKRYFSWINGLNHRPLLHDKNPSTNVYYEFLSFANLSFDDTVKVRTFYLKLALKVFKLKLSCRESFNMYSTSYK